MKYVARCKGVEWVGSIDRKDIDLIRTAAHRDHDGYARVYDQSRRRFRLLHRLVLARVVGRALVVGEQADHINHDRLDNRRCNLRVVTKSQNMQNRRGPDRDSRTGVRGVTMYYHRYRVIIPENGRNKYWGSYGTIAEAEARAEAVRSQLGFLGSSQAEQLNAVADTIEGGRS